MKKRSQWVVTAICILALSLMGCGNREEARMEAKRDEEITLHVEKQAPAVEQKQEEEGKGDRGNTGKEKESEAGTKVTSGEEGKQQPEQQTEAGKEKASGQEQTNQGGGHMVAIDAGHQSKGSSEKEPTGPGSSEMKARVTGGTKGTTTGLYEYELNLAVAQKLKAVLEERGYRVYMVRESNDVDISNAERAQMAYDSGADIFVRIHANGAENSSANGAMTICPTADNPYVSGLYEASRRLSEAVLDGIVESAGCKKERVWETDTMSGINWSSLPVTIVEMGYMTNPEEDTKLSTDAYQQLIAEGIANGIDAYYGYAG